MTQLDFIVFALLGLSALVGFWRGAAVEIVSIVALVAAAVLAIYTLPYTAPLGHRIFHSDWLAAACALLVTFIVVYVVLRLGGAMIGRRIRETQFIGTLDRSVGLAIGLARGLIVLGALNLMFNAATPADLQPKWITEARTWPLAQNMGRMLQALAPRGLDIAGRLKPAFDRALHSSARDALDDRLKSEGYDARQRQEIEGLVEKSR